MPPFLTPFSAFSSSGEQEKMPKRAIPCTSLNGMGCKETRSPFHSGFLQMPSEVEEFRAMALVRRLFSLLSQLRSSFILLLVLLLFTRSTRGANPVLIGQWPSLNIGSLKADRHSTIGFMPLDSHCLQSTSVIHRTRRSSVPAMGAEARLSMFRPISPISHPVTSIAVCKSWTSPIPQPRCKSHHTRAKPGRVPTKVVVSGSIAYVADAETGLVLLDVTDPRHPTYLSQYSRSTLNGALLDE